MHALAPSPSFAIAQQSRNAAVETIRFDSKNMISEGWGAEENSVLLFGWDLIRVDSV